MTIEREFSPSELRGEDYDDDSITWSTEEEDLDIDAQLKHRAECPHEDCLCRTPSGKPSPGDIVMAGSEPGMVIGTARDGKVTVKWGEFWQQGYDIDRFIVVGDHWEVGGA